MALFLLLFLHRVRYGSCGSRMIYSAYIGLRRRPLFMRKHPRIHRPAGQKDQNVVEASPKQAP